MTTFSVESLSNSAITMPSVAGNDLDNCVVIGNKKLPQLNWTRLNYNEEDHDNRRLVEHRARNCECEVCSRELQKLPPVEPVRVIYASKHFKKEQREIKKVKRLAKKEVKAGKQASIRNFFRY